MNSETLKPLTQRQQQIFDFIVSYRNANGAPPTRVEIAKNFGFKSANAAEDHLKALNKKGHIELRSGTSRGIFITEQALPNAQVELITQVMRLRISPLLVTLPLAPPIFAEQHVQQYLSVDQTLFADRADFLLKVKGDSMINIGIFEKDLLAIKKAERAQDNQIIVARIGDDVTVKRFQQHGATVSLIAEMMTINQSR